MPALTPFGPDVLRLDAAQETLRIADKINEQVLRGLRRRRVVLGVSGGIDSSVTAVLCAKALGANRVTAILMPEADSDPDSLRLGRLLAQHLGINCIVEDIAPILEATGCYRRRDECIRRVFPAWGAGCKCKLVLPNVLQSTGYNIFSLVIQTPDGVRTKLRPPLDVYLGIVAVVRRLLWMSFQRTAC